LIVDMTAIASALLSLASITVTATIPVVVPALLRRWHIATDSDLARRVETAAMAGAGAAYSYAASKSGGLARVNVHNEALAAGVEYVSTHLPNVLHETGCSPQLVHEMISARLGVLLAGDPTVTAGKPGGAVLPAAPVPVTTVGEPLPPGRSV
jgi:hypothetical protein